MPQQKTNRNNTKPKAARRGITLIEIAIVLVIIGILLGGVLKGQELINNARIKSLADQHNSIRAAWFSFLGKYGAMPGDYVFATQHIRGAPNRGLAYEPGNGIIGLTEVPVAFQNLASAGYLRCQQCNTPSGDSPTRQNSLVNRYGGIVAVYHNNVFIDGVGIGPISAEGTYAYRGDGDSEPRLMSHSGVNIPSNIAAEVDRKVDDGIANTGNLVFNKFAVNPLENVPPLACMSASKTKQADPTELDSADVVVWRHSSVTPERNCGFSLYL